MLLFSVHCLGLRTALVPATNLHCRCGGWEWLTLLWVHRGM